MPVTPTYPGVYIQEVDSGSRVVTGVATSITAFVGRAELGPANEPITVFNFGDFEKLFGGLTIDMPMTYAVQDFFENGGSQAIIIRVCAGPPLEAAASAVLKNDDPKYGLTARVKGAIGNKLVLSITKNAKNGENFDAALKLGSITLATTKASEDDPGLPATAIPVWLGTLSNFVRVDGSLDPDAATTVIKVGENAFTGGVDDTGGTPARFVAGDLEITAIPGSWVDDLELSIAAGSDGKSFVLNGDHPLWSDNITFANWEDLKTKLLATTLLTLTKPPQAALPFAPPQRALPPGTAAPAAGAAAPAGGAAAPAVPAAPAFPGKSIALTRIPHGQGASAAMLVVGAGEVVLMASSPGKWGNKYGVYFDKKNITVNVALRFADYDIPGTIQDFYNVNVVEVNGAKSTVVETIGPVYVGTNDAPCRIDHMLATQSAILRCTVPIKAPAQKFLLQDISQVNTNKTTTVGTTTTTVKNGMLTSGSDGESLDTDLVVGSESKRTGIYALDKADIFNIMVIPPDPMLGGDPDMKVIYAAAAKYCADHRAILIADPLDAWGFKAKKSQFDQIQPSDFNIDGIVERRSIFTYFPRIKKADPLRGNREGVFSASGMIAGVFAATDVRRGVWKAPAGVEAGLNGVTNLEWKLTDMQNGQLNQVGVNVLRDFPIVGKVVWGSRTLAGADLMSDDYKYLPVRRLTNYIEESLLRNTRWAVFEPNAEPLWATMRLAIGSFMAGLMRQGAFYEYVVKCDASTTTSDDINHGICNALVQFAPVKPAEFIILTIQQLALKPAA